MSNHKLETLGVVSLFAGEVFLLHPNIEHPKYPWLGVVIGWLVFAIVFGFIGDRFYNMIFPEKDSGNPTLRYILLIAISVLMFGVAFLGNRIFY